MKEKLLIIGSTGFIGNNALHFFRNKGYDVYCADIVIKQEENYTILNPENIDFTNLFLQHKFDVCINATGAASVPLSFQYPAIDYLLNVSNVYNMLDAIRKNCPECKFINFSSAAVYGNPISLPIYENSAINPLSPYGYHKYYSENICKEFFEMFNIQTVSLRVFSVYGEGLKKQLFWDIYKKIRNTENNQITLFGTGRESRDFIYISDLMTAIELVLTKKELKGNVINISSGIESTIKDAVEIFVNSYSPGISVKYNNQVKVGDPLNWRADISVLESLGFKSTFSLHEGLENYSQWLKSLFYND